MKFSCVFLAIAQNDSKLETLKKQRSRAIKEAIVPIDAKYQAALEALLKEATTSKDYETAKKILAEIDTRSPVGDQPLSRRLMDSRWSWPDAKFKPEVAWFHLHADGSTSAGWHKRSGTWKQLDEHTIRINVSETPKNYTLEFDRTLKWSWNTELTQQVFRRLPSK